MKEVADTKRLFDLNKILYLVSLIGGGSGIYTPSSVEFDIGTQLAHPDE